MLAIFYGNDTTAVRSHAQAYIDEVLGSTTPKATIESLSVETYMPGAVRAYHGAASLFGDRRVVRIDTPSENEAFFEEVCAHAADCHASLDTFVVVESALSAAQKKRLLLSGAHTQEYTQKKQTTFNIFALTDAFVARDKKQLWITYTRALRAHASGEELIGTLFWQVKTLRLVAQTDSADAAGVKPYTYTKAQQALRKYTRDELDQYSRDLVSIYHDAHRGTRNIHTALERWVLSL